MTSRRQVLPAAPALAAIGFAGGAKAQADYPQRVGKFLIGNAPGGNDDTISRVIAERLSKDLGQTFIVEDSVGGSISTSRSIAGAVVAAAPADGYTIQCLINAGIVQTDSRDQLPYKPSILVPIVGVGDSPLGLAVSAMATPKITRSE